MISRRIVLAGTLASLPFAITGAAAATSAPAGLRVDVGPLVAAGVGPNAARIKALLERELAGAARASGASVSVRVTSLFMSSFGGGGSGGLGSGGGQDALESETTIIGRDGRARDVFPVLSSSPSASGGRNNDSSGDLLRLETLVRGHAGWITRRLGA